MRRFALTVAAALATPVLAGCGGSDSPSAASSGRAVKITMTDNAYRPASIHVAKGETVTFSFVNDGKVDHEALIGDATAQAAHEDEMANMPDMHHGGTDVLTVKPGTTGALTHTFDTSGELLVGCHEPGHYSSGMKLAVTVS
jgi:uncharacterized cupredoxin-like copper-binding protein